jgi:hypothetical protein
MQLLITSGGADNVKGLVVGFRGPNYRPKVLLSVVGQSFLHAVKGLGGYCNVKEVWEDAESIKHSAAFVRRRLGSHKSGHRYWKYDARADGYSPATPVLPGPG